jgi:DHA1 family florfenicol/chloramphenicol resistance protein-like MFS transporter
MSAAAVRCANRPQQTAVALYFCIESIIVSFAETFFVLLLGGDRAWPLVGYVCVTALTTLAGLWSLREPA